MWGKIINKRRMAMRAVRLFFKCLVLIIYQFKMRLKSKFSGFGT